MAGAEHIVVELLGPQGGCPARDAPKASTLFALAGCGVAGLLVVPHHCPSTRGGAPPEEATKCAAALPEPHMEEVGLQM